MPDNILYALDFDGVICDSALETGLTSWNTATTLWPDMPSGPAPAEIIEQFRAVRPLLETGYEAPLIIRLLYNGVSVGEMFVDYHQKLEALIRQDNLEIAELKRLFGEIRDQMIADDEQKWVEMNPLFAGVAEKLCGLNAEDWYIVTTKQERFAKRILQQNQIGITDEHIYGLDRQLTKQQVLEKLIAVHPGREIVFVEDRLPTLRGMESNPA
ncbi:MAG: Unknown protein, partial [uncultured Thiotrichaceae bacterium]